MEVVKELFAAHFQDQLHRFIDDLSGSRVGTINFVDDDDRFQPRLKCFAQDEASLWHWAFSSINEQQGSVCHLEDTFDLATKIRVTWCVDDVDLHAFIRKRNVLRENRDPTFFFNVT